MDEEQCKPVSSHPTKQQQSANTSSRPNQQNSKAIRNQLSLHEYIEKDQWTELKKARSTIALLSTKNALIRVQKEKMFQESFDQIELQELFDEKVSQNINYQEYSAHFADSSAINRGKFTPDGSFYGTVGSTGEGKIWSTSQSTNHSGFCQEITSLKTNTKVCDIAFHPKVNEIPQFAPNICTSNSNGELHFWTFDKNLPSQKSIKISGSTEQQRVNSISFHTTGHYLLSSSYDTTFSLWDLTKLRAIYKQKGHQRQIHVGCLHPDGSLYMTGDLAGYGQIWDLRIGKGIYEFKESDSILCADWNPNGFEMALGGKSNMVTIKDLRRKKNLRNIPAHTKLISGVKYSEDGYILSSVSHDDHLKLWHGKSYINVNLEPLVHSSKVTSVDICNGMLATTTIERKWIMWMLKGGFKGEFTANGDQSERDRSDEAVKVEHEQELQN